MQLYVRLKVGMLTVFRGALNGSIRASRSEMLEFKKVAKWNRGAIA